MLLSRQTKKSTKTLLNIQKFHHIRFSCFSCFSFILSFFTKKRKSFLHTISHNILISLSLSLSLPLSLSLSSLLSLSLSLPLSPQVTPLLGFWQTVMPTLPEGSFDGILFDDYPISSQQRDEFAETMLFKESYRLLKKGGVLVYYSGYYYYYYYCCCCY